MTWMFRVKQLIVGGNGSTKKQASNHPTKLVLWCFQTEREKCRMLWMLIVQLHTPLQPRYKVHRNTTVSQFPVTPWKLYS